MKLIIAGYNIDSSLIKQLNSSQATPEVISAAYARISRSAKSVDELRIEAIQELEKARKSNTNIVFEMGHASVAEHAVFNLDLIDVSRLLTESVQRSRLASFTEKSQRYVTFGRDYLIPNEINAIPKLKKKYTELMKKLFAEYEASYSILLTNYKEQHSGIKLRELEGMAKEDARYILPLSTLTQMGITINARSAEALLRRLSNIPLAEANTLKQLLYDQLSAIAPSLIRHTEADGFKGTIDLDKVGFSNFLQQELPWLAELDYESKVKTISTPKNADDAVLSALVYANSELGWQDNLDTVSKLPKIAREQLWQQVFRGIRSWHKLPRAFEAAEYEFELHLSEACWAQLKRHRTCTMLKKANSSGLHVIPDSIKQIKRDKIWQQLAVESQLLSDSLPDTLKPMSGYLKLNSSLCRVYVKMNLREIYHFVRLRSDEHAQWEIREISDAISRIVQRSAPNAARCLSGKSEFKPGL